MLNIDLDWKGMRDIVNEDRTLPVGQKLYSKLLGKTVTVTVGNITGRCHGCAYEEFCIGKHAELAPIRIIEAGNCSSGGRIDGNSIYYKSDTDTINTDPKILKELSTVLNSVETADEFSEAVDDIKMILGLIKENKEP